MAARRAALASGAGPAPRGPPTGQGLPRSKGGLERFVEGKELVKVGEKEQEKEWAKEEIGKVVCAVAAISHQSVSIPFSIFFTI